MADIMPASLPDAPVFTLVSVADDGSAPVEGLARALEGLQALMRVLGDDGGGRKTARRHALRARPVEAGLALYLGAPQLALDLGLGGSPGEVGQAAIAALAAVAAEDDAALARAVPEPDRRKRVLAAIRQGLPRAGEGWTLVVTPPDGAPIALGAREAASLAQSAPDKGGPVRMTVTGELTGVDFGAGRLTLKVAATGKAITGPYPPALEVKLLKLRRKAVHLSGDFALDAVGEPRALKLAADLAPVDLAPITLERVATPLGPVAFEPPLTLAPALDAASGQRYVAGDLLLELACEADSRDELEYALRAEVAARWAAYARPGLAGREAALAKMWRRRARAVQAHEAEAAG